jgi:hypothetical protein
VFSVGVRVTMADEQKVPHASGTDEDGSGISRPTHVKRLLSVTVGPNQELQVRGEGPPEGIDSVISCANDWMWRCVVLCSHCMGRRVCLLSIALSCHY